MFWFYYRRLEIKHIVKQMEIKEQVMEQYNGSQIVVLEGLEAVRKRPGMYIGSTGSRGLHHLIWEILEDRKSVV